MPTYLNNLAQPIFIKNSVFKPNELTAINDEINNRAYIIGSIAETFNITLSSNDTFIIRFNEATTWTTVTLTAGAARTAAQIVSDINTAVGLTVASDEGGKIRIDAPIENNYISAIYIKSTGNTANATLGFTGADVLPVKLVSKQAFILSTLSDTYNITSSNNIFIFKFNKNQEWITVELTIGAARTCAQIVAELNSAYSAKYSGGPIAVEVTPVTLESNYIKIISPLSNNYESYIYIKSTGNTALSVLGFSGDNFNPIVSNGYPELIKIANIPLFNPVIKETTVSFAATSTQYFYLTNPIETKIVEFIRVTGSLTIYLQSTDNTPPITMAAGETFILRLPSSIDRFVITSSGASGLLIRELRG